MKHIKEYNTFDNFEWDDEEIESTDYYYGTISPDHIEIYPVTIKNNIIYRISDMKELNKLYYNNYHYLIRDKYFIFVNNILKTGIIYYMYNKNIKKDYLRNSLRKTISTIDILSRWTKEEYYKILRNSDNFYYDGQDWKIISLI